MVLLFENEYLVILDASGCSLLHAWEIFESRHSILSAQVDDQQMGCRGILLCLPEGGFLQVKGFVARVVSLQILGVGILHAPLVSWDALTVLILEIDFGHSHGLAVMCGGTLYGQESSLCCLAEGDGLPSIASLRRSLCHGCG